MDSLDLLREEIDVIDDTICQLIKKRLSIVKNIFAIKEKNASGKKFSIRDMHREKMVLNQLLHRHADELPEKLISDIFILILDTSVSLQESMQSGKKTIL